MTTARLDARVGTSSAGKILLRYETLLWSLKEEVEWGAMAPEQTERARDSLREIRDRVDFLLKQISAYSDKSGVLFTIQFEQPEAGRDDAPEAPEAVEAMTNGGPSEAKKERMLDGWEASDDGGEGAKPALKKRRGRREGKKTGKALKGSWQGHD